MFPRIYQLAGASFGPPCLKFALCASAPSCRQLCCVNPWWICWDASMARLLPDVSRRCACRGLQVQQHRLSHMPRLLYTNHARRHFCMNGHFLAVAKSFGTLIFQELTGQASASHVAFQRRLTRFCRSAARIPRSCFESDVVKIGRKASNAAAMQVRNCEQTHGPTAMIYSS